MKTIGIIGMSLKDFTDWCKIRKYKKIRPDRYLDEQNNDEYIHLPDNPFSVIGRSFDEIIDYNFLRLDLLAHLKINGKYILGNYEFKRSEKNE